MLNLSIYDVKDLHISNAQIREELGCNTLTQSMELRRARWLEKLANMPETRNPRKILVAWTPNPRPTGRPGAQTIRHAYAHTLEKELNISSQLKVWIPEARNHENWAQRVEHSLDLAKGTHKPYKLR